MRDLIHQGAASLSFWLINGALPVALVCAALNWTIPFQGAAALLGAGLVLAAANVVGVLVPRSVRPQATRPGGMPA